MTEANVPDRAFRWSLAGHGLLLVLVLMGGLSLPRSPPPTQLAIQATVVDSNSTSRSPVAPRPAPTAKPKPLPEEKAAPKPDPRLEQRRVEQQKLEKLEKQEKQRTDQIKAQQAAEKQEKLEKDKKQEKEKKEREKAATEKLQAEKLQAEKLKADQLRKEAAEREIARQLEAEERLLAATESGALADYVAMIGQKVTRSWIRPPSARAGLECEVVVSQIPGGEVIGVKVERCNGDEAVRRSIEAAVLKASPLPLPDEPSLFDRSLRFTFKPEQ